MGIKSKILLLVGLMIAVTVTVMTTIINIKTEKFSKDLVYQIAEQTANRYGNEVEMV